MTEGSLNDDIVAPPEGAGMAIASADVPIHSFDGVLEGGGIWGIGHVGAYAALYERGYRPQNIAGTSAGAIVGCLVLAGYDEPAELRRHFDDAFAPNSSTQNLWRSVITVTREIAEFGVKNGFCDTSPFKRWLTGLLEAKNIRTFGDMLYDASEPIDSPYRYKLQVVASDVTLGRRLVWPRDAHLYNLHPDDFPVADAVVMSMSIPFFFQPYKLNYKDQAGKPQSSLIVDGGLLSNFPIDLFDVPKGQTPKWPTFGMRLVQSASAERSDTSSILKFLKAVAIAVIKGNVDADLSWHTQIRNIRISTLGISPVNWNLTPAQREDLYQAGYQAANAFLDTWDFAGYKATRSRLP